MQSSPNLIVFAGPNGSGKSTLVEYLLQLNYPIGKHINPDAIASTLTGSYEARSFNAQAIADELRESCLSERCNFSFETVMSHPSKIEFMQRARNAGYIVTLFFVSVEHAEINVERVARRVALNGHDVPVERIRRRYGATMAALPDAVRCCHRTVLFDNSIAFSESISIGPRTVAEIMGTQISIFPPTPKWVEKFSAVYPARTP